MINIPVHFLLLVFIFCLLDSVQGLGPVFFIVYMMFVASPVARLLMFTILMSVVVFNTRSSLNGKCLNQCTQCDGMVLCILPNELMITWCELSHSTSHPQQLRLILRICGSYVFLHTVLFYIYENAFVSDHDFRSLMDGIQCSQSRRLKLLSACHSVVGSNHLAQGSGGEEERRLIADRNQGRQHKLLCFPLSW